MSKVGDAISLTINGTKFPQPRRGLELLSATIVDSARNANGVVVGQKVGGYWTASYIPFTDVMSVQ